MRTLFTGVWVVLFCLKSDSGQGKVENTSKFPLFCMQRSACTRWNCQIHFSVRNGIFVGLEHLYVVNVIMLAIRRKRNLVCFWVMLMTTMNLMRHKFDNNKHNMCHRTEEISSARMFWGPIGLKLLKIFCRVRPLDPQHLFVVMFNSFTGYMK